MHLGNKCCLKPRIPRGRWEAQFKDSCRCRDGSAEHVACGKCPCGSREGSSCHLGGVSKSIDFMQTSEVNPFAFSTPGSCHLQERTCLDTGICNPTFVLLQACWMLTAISHQGQWWKLFPCFSKARILDLTILCRRCSLPGPWPHVSLFVGASV